MPDGAIPVGAAEVIPDDAIPVGAAGVIPDDEIPVGAAGVIPDAASGKSSGCAPGTVHGAERLHAGDAEKMTAEMFSFP